MGGNPVVEYFDGVAGVYDQVLPFFADFAGQATRHIAPAPGIEALDVAAGRGAFVMDAARLDFPTAAFDLVVCGFAIHIVADPHTALAEAVRVTKRGGRLAFTVPGRADGSPDPWSDPLVELFAEYRRLQADGFGRHGNDVDEDELFAQSGLTDISATTLEVALPIPDGETYWRWSRSHGSGRFIDGLPADKRDEMHSRLVKRIREIPGFTLRRSATLWLGRKPE